jgi:hypothetical protein
MPASGSHSLCEWLPVSVSRMKQRGAPPPLIGLAGWEVQAFMLASRVRLDLLEREGSRTFQRLTEAVCERLLRGSGTGQCHAN